MILTLLLGLFIGKALMAGAMIVLAGHAVINTSVLRYIKQYASSRAMLCFLALPISYVIASIIHQDGWQVLGVIKSKLPLLFFPFAVFAFNDYLTKKHYQFFLHFLVLLVCIASTYSWFFLIRDFNAINNSYLKASTMPTFISHIRFSLLIAFSLIWCLHAYFNDSILRYKSEKKVLLILFLYLFITLHILAVRSGLVAFYISFLVYASSYYIQQKKWRQLLITFTILVFGFMLMYSTIPSLQNKIKYSVYDWELFVTNTELKNISDGKRFAAFEAAYSIFKNNLWAGVGLPNVKREINSYFTVHYVSLKNEYLDAHNQFLNTSVAAGIFGLVGLLVTLFGCILYSHLKQSLLARAFVSIMFLSFLVESTLESQLGLTIFIVLYLLIYKLEEVIHNE